MPRIWHLVSRRNHWSVATTPPPRIVVTPTRKWTSNISTARLKFADINAKPSEPDIEYHMKAPGGGYKDLHAGHHNIMPAITHDSILSYYISNQKQYDNKVEALFNERYLMYARLAITDGDADEADRSQLQYFFTASVWAEMKKTTSYGVDIKITKDGVIEEAQCECAVGQGPTAHCKHVGCLLYGLVCFLKDEVLTTEVTCTQVLQTFHQVQPNKGTPVKTNDLVRLRGKKGALLRDPRPERFRNMGEEADSRTRNLAINYQASHDIRMPIMQLYPPANLYAVANDHSYEQLSMEDAFLRKIKVTTITKEEVAEIEGATRPQSVDQRWKEERQCRITSSNFGSICKATSRRDYTKLIMSFLGETSFTSRATSHGIKYESVAVKKLESELNIKTSVCGLFVSEERPMLAASPDRLIDDTTIVEVKCPCTSKDKNISPVTVPYLEVSKSGQLTLVKSHNYYYQVQGQMYCTKRKLCKFVVFTLKDIKIIDIPTFLAMKILLQKCWLN